MTRPLVFEPISDGDVEATIALWTACGLVRPWNDPAKDIAFARGKPGSEVLVARLDERLVASVMVGHDGHRGIVYYVSVDPANAGPGIWAPGDGGGRRLAEGPWHLEAQPAGEGGK